MLDHVSEELEVVEMAERVQAVVQHGQGDEDVDQVCQAGMRQVVSVGLDLKSVEARQWWWRLQ